MIERKSTPPVAPRHILVVEDDPDVARAEKRSLERRPAYAEVQKRVSMLVPLPRRQG